jgi:putative hydrolase of the HAD superfamily
MILVFDLDDTLYEELSFIGSGYKAVAEYLATLKGIDEAEIFSKLLIQLQINRNQVFDHVLKEYNIYSRSLVIKCLGRYRTHKPEIELYPDAKRCLERFTEFSKYLVTDGNKIVQANKIEALNLKRYFKVLFITHNHGIKYAKPSPYIFQAICMREKTQPSQVIYIGDNPKKDFVGIKPLGFRTIRIMRGCNKDIELENSFEAEIRINTLDELSMEFIRNLYQ